MNYEKQAKPRNRFKLDNIRRLLALAGNPQAQLKNVVLVGGTKGKGSVCYMLESALRACGLRTGLFVSPHVSTVRERIQLDGEYLSKRAFAALAERFRPLVRQQPVSYFELITAMAFELFARKQPDWTVIEVGLGGRLDATNLCKPTVSVITRIGLDHVAVLGRTVRKIAREKAGIMRVGRPVVIGMQVPEAKAELSHQAYRIGAELVPATDRVRVWNVEAVSVQKAKVPGAQGLGGGVAFSVLSELGAGRIELPLLGQHQVENCATVLGVLGLLAREDCRIRLDSVKQGLAKVSIPARCQVVSQEPLVVLDSCHNPDSGRALAEAIEMHLGTKVILVYGSLSGKLITATVAPLVPKVEIVILVEPASPRAEKISHLKRIFTRLGIRHVAAGSVRTGLAEALRLAADKTPVVVAGSFYVAGEALQELGKKQKQTVLVADKGK
ncbi:MAG: folylpolyglutamate synthase/dihydrofolate synthase family protein [candidate division WOR-3 bacterium]